MVLYPQHRLARRRFPGSGDSQRREQGQRTRHGEASPALAQQQRKLPSCEVHHAQWAEFFIGRKQAGADSCREEAAGYNGMLEQAAAVIQANQLDAAVRTGQ